MPSNNSVAVRPFDSPQKTMSYNRGRLIRSQSNKMVGGVLSGLARHYGLDLTWLRIGVVLASFVTFGTVVVCYIVAMFLMPTE